MALDSIIYTAHANVTGGRDGIATTDDGKISFKLGVPKEMGGKSEGTNPEQMFAAGYSACFIGALQVAAKAQKVVLPADTSIHADISFGPRAGGAKGFGLEVAMAIDLPGLNRAEAEALVHEAHEICPYSNATRGNVEVTLSVV